MCHTFKPCKNRYSSFLFALLCHSVTSDVNLLLLRSLVPLGLLHRGHTAGPMGRRRPRSGDGLEAPGRRRKIAARREGPGTLLDAMAWPADITNALRYSPEGEADDTYLLRLQNNCQQQNIIITDYSGWECPYWGMSAMTAEWEARLGWDSDMLADAFQFVRSCDYGQVQGRVLNAMSHHCHASQCCVQGDMLARLPKKAQNYIASSRPDPEALVEIRAAAHRELHEWLMANRSWVYPVDAQAPCTVHGRRCYMNGWMKVPEPLRDSEERPSIWNIAGITCHAWSAEGNQEGLAHPFGRLPLGVAL